MKEQAELQRYWIQAPGTLLNIAIVNQDGPTILRRQSVFAVEVAVDATPNCLRNSGLEVIHPRQIMTAKNLGLIRIV